MTEYYYVAEQIHEFAVRKGLSWLARHSKPDGAGWIAIREAGSIRFISRYSRYRGLSPLKQLAKPPYKTELFGLGLRLITPQKLPENYQGLHVLAIFPPHDFIEKLLVIPGARKLLVVPWSREEAEHWIARSGAAIYNQSLTSNFDRP